MFDLFGIPVGELIQFVLQLLTLVTTLHQPSKFLLSLILCTTSEFQWWKEKNHVFDFHSKYISRFSGESSVGMLKYRPLGNPSQLSLIP